VGKTFFFLQVFYYGAFACTEGACDAYGYHV
jgi:hypothetical protein